jgi:hypothetical protein
MCRGEKLRGGTRELASAESGPWAKVRRNTPEGQPRWSVELGGGPLRDRKLQPCVGRPTMIGGFSFPLAGKEPSRR